MSLIKYIAIAALVMFGVVLALIGILSVTHDTPVTSVIAEGDKGGPPSIEDPLFARSIEANSAHGSDSVENARAEIAWFFAQTEIVRYEWKKR